MAHKVVVMSSLVVVAVVMTPQCQHQHLEHVK